MNPPPQDMNMIWMPATTSIEGFFPPQGVQLPALDELTQHSALMDPSIPNELMAAAAGQMTTLSMNPVELFQLQQQQQAAQLQLQQQIEFQNFTAAMASQVQSQVAVKPEDVDGRGGMSTMTNDVDDDADEIDDEGDEEMEPHYVPNPYAFNELTGDYNSNSNSSIREFELLGQQQDMFNALNANRSASTQTSSTKESFKKIKPVKRPGLVLKTPIAYQGNIDKSVIPIQPDGMAICEKCGAIGVKHSFYTRQRRFCSMACARGFELTSIQSALQAAKESNTVMPSESGPLQKQSEQLMQQQNYKFKFANGTSTEESSTSYSTVLPQGEIPQIPKPSRLPSPCPQDERIQTIRRRPNEFGNSYDWTLQLGDADFSAAPVTCFRHAPGYDMWPNIVTNMKVEVENTDSDQTIVMGNVPHSFWVATVLRIQGYKAYLRYEGFGDDGTHDFWVNLCSSEVHPVGWCATRGKPLIPPRSIENKYSDWKEFLVHHLSGARTLPSTFYNKISDSFRSRFRVGQQLEVVDKNRISQMKVATVCKVVGKRLFVQYYDGPPEDGFWCHEDSSLIHHVGWSASVGHNLAAPEEYLERVNDEIFQPLHTDSTTELFKMNFSFEDYYLDGRKTGFMKGMKLEAIDPLNLSSICVATVMDVLNFGYIMIRIDSYDPDATGADWFCYHEKSPNIFPSGFCAKNNINLTPPKGYDATNFTWEQYLIDTQSTAAQEDLFPSEKYRQRFKVGMKLECADLMDPRLVCVATISRVVGRLLKIHFDGWEDEYDQWLDSSSPDVYPVGWCYLVGHKLEGPRIQPKLQIPAKVSPKPARKRRGRKRGPRSQMDTKTPFTRTAQIKKEQEEFEQQKQKAKVQVKKERVVRVKQEPKVEAAESMMMDEAEAEESDDDYESSLNQSFETSNASVGRIDEMEEDETETPVPQEKYIPKLAGTSALDKHPVLPDPNSWTTDDVVQFLTTNDCTVHCNSFIAANVDGKRLLDLSKDSIITLLGMKVGPALKIFDLIQKLRLLVNPKLKNNVAGKRFL